LSRFLSMLVGGSHFTVLATVIFAVVLLAEGAGAAGSRGDMALEIARHPTIDMCLCEQNRQRTDQTSPTDRQIGGRALHQRSIEGE
jgi:hypothetical protein